MGPAAPILISLDVFGVQAAVPAIKSAAKMPHRRCGRENEMVGSVGITLRMGFK
jgi:hypothetical protein